LTVRREELAQRTQDPFQLRHVYSWMALLQICRGSWGEAEQLLTRQEREIEGLQSPEPRITLRAHRGVLRYLQGRFAEAGEECRSAVEAIRRSGSGTLVRSLGRWGMTLAELGQPEAALACLAELESLAEALDKRATARSFALADLTVGYFRLGAPKRA